MQYVKTADIDVLERFRSIMVSFTLHFQQHQIKSLIVCYIVLFIIFSLHILDRNNMSIKDN